MQPHKNEHAERDCDVSVAVERARNDTRRTMAACAASHGNHIAMYLSSCRVAMLPVLQATAIVLQCICRAVVLQCCLPCKPRRLHRNSSFQPSCCNAARAVSHGDCIATHLPSYLFCNAARVTRHDDCIAMYLLSYLVAMLIALSCLV